MEENIRRSEELQEILGKMPSWLIRWGTIFVFGILVIIITASCLIKYPDTLAGNIVITCENPPAKIIARSNGRIKLFFKDNECVQQGDYLAIIENTSSIDEILILKKNLQKYEESLDDPIILIGKNINLPNSYALGELQESYNRFKTACEEYMLFLDLQQNHNKIESYKNQLSILSKYENSLENKKITCDRELEIIKRQYKTDSILFTQKALLQFDFDKAEENLIRVLNKLHLLKEEELKNREDKEKINSLIDELFLTDRDQKKKLEFRIRTTYQDLKTNFMLWQQKFVLISPIEGRISLFDYWNNNQFVNIGDEVANIITNSNNVFGKLYVSGNRFGKVKKRQRVRIILDSYHPSQYGVIFGEIESISEVNKDNLYAIHVLLTNGLITNYKEKIPFKHEMKGIGEIITEDLSLMQRFFYQTRSLFLKKYEQKNKPSSSAI